MVSADKSIDSYGLVSVDTILASNASSLYDAWVIDTCDSIRDQRSASSGYVDVGLKSERV